MTRRSWPCLFIVAAVFFAYWPVRHGEFVFDDEKMVAKNDALWEGGGVDFDIFAARPKDQVRSNVRPVRFASYKLDVMLSQWWYGPGADARRPFFFHLLNILLHSANALLVFYLARKLLRAGAAPWGPLAAALAFALHPVHTESVAYISGRRDVLFLFFYLLALDQYARTRDRRGLGSGLIILGLALLAFLAKEMAITLPAAILGVEILAARQDGGRPRVPWLLLLSITGAALVLAAVVIGPQQMGGATEHWGGSITNALFTSARAQMYYLRLLVWPDPLTVDYSYDAFPASAGGLSPITGVLSLCAIAALVAAALWLFLRRERWVAVGILFFFAALLPVAQLVPHPERMAERYLYLPSLGFLCAAGGIVGPWIRRAPAPLGIALVAILLACTSLTRERLADWQGPYALWKSAVAVAPRCARAQFALAYTAREEGRFGEAMAGFTRAIEILEPLESRSPLEHGRYLQSRLLRGELSLMAGDTASLARALLDFEALCREVDTDGKAIADRPDVIAKLVRARLGLADFAGAAEAAERLLALPSAPAILKLDASRALVEIAMARGEREQAWALLERARSYCSTDRERAGVEFAQGEWLANSERWEEARARFRLSAELIGPQGRRESALYREAECMKFLGESRAAQELLRELLASDPKHLAALSSLADLSVASGEFDEAERCYRTILEVVPGETHALEGLRLAALRRELLGDTPGSKNSSRVLAWLLIAERKLAEGKLDDAVKALAAAVEHAEGPTLEPQRMQACLLLARTQAQLKQWKEADAAYSRYLALATLPLMRRDPLLEAATVKTILEGPQAAYLLLDREWSGGVRDARIAKRLAEIAEVMGDRERAASWLREYVDLEAASFGAPGDGAKNDDAKRGDLEQPPPSAPPGVRR